jgi:hypothetical protein
MWMEDSKVNIKVDDLSLVACCLSSIDKGTESYLFPLVQKNSQRTLEHEVPAAKEYIRRIEICMGW